MCNDKPPAFFSDKFSYRTQHRDSIEAKKEINDLLRSVTLGGYLAASVDSLQVDSTSATAYVYVGDRADGIVLRSTPTSQLWVAEAGLRHKIDGERVHRINAFATLREKILRACEDRGYPFAEVRLDSIKLTEGRFWAALAVQPNDYIIYDSLQIIGKTKIKLIFLKNYLGIKPGKPYNETNVRRISQRIGELQFVEQASSPAVEFTTGKATVMTFLRDRKASQFNFLLGLLPGSSGKRVLITGEARFHLFSLLGLGEEFYVEWQKLQPKTQRLDTRVSFPYLAGLPLGVLARVEMYKRDTTFIDVEGEYGVRYQIIGSNYIQAAYRQRITFILQTDTQRIKLTRALPENLDVSSNEFSLEYFYQNLNYRFNPVRGWVMRLGGTAGIKQIRKNNQIVSLYDEVAGKPFAHLYDTARMRTFQFRISATIEKYWRLADRHTIKTNIDGRYFFSQRVFTNEMYRLGGNSSLRGFDDQSIFTPYYLLGNVEYRFLLTRNSYTGVFFNAALVRDLRASANKPDWPFGFGATGSIETKAGIFAITYALGRQLGNRLAFRESKIHFGYINYF
ncbi:MAG: BamA/TamA family outer membrane protein [Chitinophagales bacterium]|nr:BamA/TamA family outer membrane protein [Chitinophagales bacterium]MDW8418392.1 BamA/TamA family outer membrane protein [Chitinophagales bacterium]